MRTAGLGMNSVGTTSYDLIIIGSGNGACAFLCEYLSRAPQNARILVLERGDHFFGTSYFTHQANWNRSYAQGNIFKLHNTLTPEGVPIISGGACTMGGGGSINYSMMHESSKWLSDQLGHDEAYWDRLKAELNVKFQRTDPALHETPMTKRILAACQEFGYKKPDPHHSIESIPSFEDVPNRQLYRFPTQFNSSGQRTNSGVSLVDWDDPRIHLKVRTQAERLLFSSNDNAESLAMKQPHAVCTGVEMKDLESGAICTAKIEPRGKMVVCAGAGTPVLLMPHRKLFKNDLIGKGVSDHIVLPLGIYVVDKTTKVSLKDSYTPIFATSAWKPSDTQAGDEVVCGIDFFAGTFDKLLFWVSHLYLAFLLPNFVKRIILCNPGLFTITATFLRVLVTVFNFLGNMPQGIVDLLNGKQWSPGSLQLVTAVLKYNPHYEGEYANDKRQIILPFFGEVDIKTTDASKPHDRDKAVAREVLMDHIPLLERIGRRPSPFFEWIYRLFTGIPYSEKQVHQYVDVYSKRHLLSQQHLSGGCLMGKAIDKGLEDRTQTGLVHGSNNVYVADLAAVPLPRVSPQMTAYLIGFHIAKQSF